MQHAREVCRNELGVKKEQSLWDAYGKDLDEYIYAACSAETEGLWCAACKRHTAVVEMLQTRSADEGMTAFLVCQRCKARRRFS